MSDEGRGPTGDSTRDAAGTDDGPEPGGDPDPGDGNEGPAGPGGVEPPSEAPESPEARPEAGTTEASSGGQRQTAEPAADPPDPETSGGAEQRQAVAPTPGGASAAVEDEPADDVPEDVRSYDRFTKVDRASYDRVNEFLRDRTYVTAREWAIARLCADFRTATGVEMTKIGRHLPELVPFMTDTYSPQAVNQARSAFEEKVRMAGATFLYGAMSGFFTADELDELMYEVTEVAKFLLEVEGVELTVDEELDAEDRISAVMREVRRASEELRYDDVACPHCGQAFRPDADEH